jgi:hypothetical protein
MLDSCGQRGVINFMLLMICVSCYADAHLRFWGILVLVTVLQHLLQQLLI